MGVTDSNQPLFVLTSMRGSPLVEIVTTGHEGLRQWSCWSSILHSNFNMNTVEFSQQLKVLRSRLAIIPQYSDSAFTSPKYLLKEAVEEIQVALEELRNAEEELYQQNEELAIARTLVEVERQRYQEFFEFAPYGYLVTDIRGKIQEANHAAATLLNIKQKFLIGKPLVIFVAEAERHNFSTFLTQVRSLDGVWEREVRLQSRNNISFDAALTIVTVRDQEGKPVALRICLRDITDRKRTESALREVEKLEELNRLKDDFLITISHELRTPISNMDVAIQMLQTTVVPEQQERYLQILQSECYREAELINTLLDIQQLEAATYSILVETVSLQDWLPSIIEPFQLRTRQRHQLLRVNIPSGLLPLISERDSLGRVLAELLNNACKYTPADGEIVLSVRQKESKGRGAKGGMGFSTIFTISNSTEISAADLPHIFEKFYRVRNKNSWEQSGTGLGLSLVQKLVERLSGTISVESSLSWTTFIIQLPTLSEPDR